MKAIESVESVADLSSLVIGSNPTNLLIGKMAEFEYEVIDVLKGKETAHCVVGFSYENSVKGTIEINMIKEERVENRQPEKRAFRQDRIV